jgi:hypothetical protein
VTVPSTTPTRCLLLAAALLLPTVPGPSAGQEEVVSSLRGEVRVGEEPLSGATVVLHLVGPETSGEIDSIQTASDGSFEILLPHVPSHSVDSEIFFASVQYRGLYYFGPAITNAVQLDSTYIIQAYDTLTVPPGGADLTLLSRSLFLEKRSDGWTATDVFQLQQEGDRTLYSPEDGVTWSYPLPSGTRNFEVGQADFAPEMIRLDGERMKMSTPLPPGERYLMVRYDLPDNEFLLPLPGRTDRLEILVREPGPPAEFPPLMVADPVELEPGNVYRRYAGDSLSNTQIQAAVAPEPWVFPAEWMGLLLAVLLGAVGVYGLRRRGQGSRSSPVPEQQWGRDELVLAIARMDEAFERDPEPSPEARTAYEARRLALLSELRRSS